MDISREPRHVLDMYGAQPGAASFNNNCLLARRLVEQGVRFVQLHDWGWDFHGTANDSAIQTGLTRKCAPTDRAVAALLRNLKARGMLYSPRAVWGCEFVRHPFSASGTAVT